MTEQILILALVSHVEVMKLVYFSHINKSFPVVYVLNPGPSSFLVCGMLNSHGIVFYIS